jgi:NADH-quinone oxidoreductase subunit C
LSSGPEPGDAPPDEPVGEGGSAADAPEEAPEAEQAPVDEDREALVATLREVLGDALVEHHIRPDDDVWVRVDRDSWTQAAEAVRDHLGCTYFSYLSAIDWLASPFGRDMGAAEDEDTPPVIVTSEPEGGWVTGYAGGATRFQLLARLEKPGEDRGITLKADLPDGDLRADTWSGLFAGADWHEREAWEMFGIDFTGHPGLSHIYLPGEFEGNPLRKDFPLLARRVKPWPGIIDVEPMPGEDAPPASAAESGDVDPEAAAADATTSSAEEGAS